MQNMYIITGVCGHLGNTVANMLIRRGERVRGLALPDENSEMLPPEVGIYRGDVCQPETMEPLFEGLSPEDQVIFIHTAGIITITGKNKELVERVNVSGTQNVIDLCLRHTVKKLLYVSSVHAIPEPPAGEEITEISQFSPDAVEGIYSKTKAEATRRVLAAADSLDVTVVHPSGIIGPNDYGGGLMTQLVKDYLEGTVTACVKGGYDFVDVRDVAGGVIAAAQKGRRGECYILSDKYFDIRELLQLLRALTGRGKVNAVLPLWFVRMFAPLAEAYFRIKKEKALFTADSLKILNSNAKFSYRKAARELGYKTRDIAVTLRDTVQFLQANGRLKRQMA